VARRLRISEALALAESDLDSGRGAILVRHGKGGKRREVGMDRWAWEQLDPWLKLRSTLPVGALFSVLRGPTRGRPWSPAGVRAQLHVVAGRAGVRRPLRRISCVTRTRWRCHAKGCRCS
jgi:integrase